jgi:hypothetical protein
MFDIYKITTRMGLTGEAMEIGVGPIGKCRLLEFIQNDRQVHLVEGLPKYQDAIVAKFLDAENVKLYPIIISDEPGTEKIFDRGEGSWITKLPSSPDTQNNGVRINQKKCCEVNAMTLGQIDPGNIEIMLIDIEGAEWYALQTMKSRPKLIVLETHLTFHRYKNPYMTQINDWMAKNCYEVIAIDESDTMYAKKEV